MKLTAWDKFFTAAISEVLIPETDVLDIGAGLRVDGSKGNIVDPKREWIRPLITNVRYTVMDPVDTYHPDVVGDIQNMPFSDNSFDAVICLAVLEHVQRPWEAADEMLRVLRPGGVLFGYVPFLSPYHAMPGYYGDYFRYTDDGIASLFDKWENIRIQHVRGPVETLVHLLPGRLGSRVISGIGGIVDRLRHASGKQTSGYFFTARKKMLDV
jgi:SAM-dependent methyltransferase